MEQDVIAIGTVEPLPAAAASSARLPTAAPGLIDLQINGYAGHDFNLLPLKVGLVGDVARRLWAEGVTTFFPTVINYGDTTTLTFTTGQVGFDGGDTRGRRRRDAPEQPRIHPVAA